MSLRFGLWNRSKTSNDQILRTAQLAHCVNHCFPPLNPPKGPIAAWVLCVITVMLRGYEPDSSCPPYSHWYTAASGQSRSDIRSEQRMLVITRREGEEVVIGDPKNPIGVVRIASVKGERVRVAFDFPRDVEIHRREIADQIIIEIEEPPAVIGEIKPATAQ